MSSLFRAKALTIHDLSSSRLVVLSSALLLYVALMLKIQSHPVQTHTFGVQIDFFYLIIKYSFTLWHLKCITKDNIANWNSCLTQSVIGGPETGGSVANSSERKVAIGCAIIKNKWQCEQMVIIVFFFLTNKNSLHTHRLCLPAHRKSGSWSCWSRLSMAGSATEGADSSEINLRC